jgi:membrane protein implicated in regulation of membrane protease activity
LPRSKSAEGDPVMSVAVEDAVFAICALVGVGLLVAVIVFDDQLASLLDALHVQLDVPAQSWTPLLLGFIAAFGVGGLVATQLVGVGGLGALIAAIVAGVIGALLASTLFGWLRRAETTSPLSVRELVGRDGSVGAAIQAGRFGSVYVKAGGQNHEYSATAATDLASGTAVTITAALGNGLVVTPIESGSPIASLLEGESRDV